MMHRLMELLAAVLMATNTYSASLNTEQVNIQDGDILENDMLGAFDNQNIGRDKRSSLFTVWKLIMRGTRTCMQCRNREAYEKLGGLQQALRDFEMLDPTDLKIYPDGAMTGHVGDRLVHLEVNEIPSLYISEKRGVGVETIKKGREIFYVNRFNTNINWDNMW